LIRFDYFKVARRRYYNWYYNSTRLRMAYHRHDG
jgi:hypothetical protein